MRRSPEPDAGFLQFWAKYPRHIARQDALKAWAQLKPSAALLAKILEALGWQCEQPRWRDVEYIPYPATWLRGWRWEDEPTPATPPIDHAVMDKLRWSRLTPFEQARRLGLKK